MGIVIQGTSKEIAHVLLTFQSFFHESNLTLQDNESTGNGIPLHKVEEISGNWVKSTLID